MHAVKLVLLLVLTLALMRALSWGLGWLSFRFGRLSVRASTVVGNAAGLGLFVGFLFWDLAPGEPLDTAALVFGVSVFALYQALDLRWRWWG